mmetsp:Transcript_31262/g.72909  ORF Transcript_31262/g.72909 Transcript_31262/m.72909 type:complete len:213 (-) Transcript_31262:171-809(-)
MAKAAVLWLHGLGDEGPSWRGAFSAVDRMVKDIKWVHPTAPEQEVSIQDGEICTSWFDIKTWPIGLKEPEGATGIDKTVVSVHKMLEKLEAEGYPSERIILGGFSQGGTVSLLAGLSYPRRLGGVVSISGWLTYRAAFAEKVSEAGKSVPCLFTCGKGDPVVTHEITKESASILEGLLGSNVTCLHANRFEHFQNAEEQRAVEDFMIKVFTA